MADIVNLRRARKAHERARRQSAAAEARMRHGRARDERALTEDENRRAALWLDSHQISDPPSSAGDD